MSNITKSLNGIFDVPSEVEDDLSFTPPTVIGTPQEVTAVPFTHPERSDEVENQEQDFKTARKNMREIVEKGNQILDGIMSVASDTDKPSAYEAAGVILKTLVDANEKLIDIHDKHKKFRQIDGGVNPVSHVTNIDKAVFVGTATELLDEVDRELKEAKRLNG